MLSDLPANTPIPNVKVGCPAVSSGEAEIVESIMPAASGLMVQFFRDMAGKEGH